MRLTSRQGIPQLNRCPPVTLRLCQPPTGTLVKDVSGSHTPLAVLPYYRPGSGELAQAVGEAAVGHDSMLLRNHGVICLGAALEEAVDRSEELEETAKLWFLTRGEKLRMLTAGEQDEIRRVFRGAR